MISCDLCDLKGPAEFVTLRNEGEHNEAYVCAMCSAVIDFSTVREWIEALTEENAELRKCGTCGGKPEEHDSGLLCICGDGTRESEVKALRKCIYERGLYLADFDTRTADLARKDAALRKCVSVLETHDIAKAVRDIARAALTAAEPEPLTDDEWEQVADVCPGGNHDPKPFPEPSPLAVGDEVWVVSGFLGGVSGPMKVTEVEDSHIATENGVWSRDLVFASEQAARAEAERRGR